MDYSLQVNVKFISRSFYYLVYRSIYIVVLFLDWLWYYFREFKIIYEELKKIEIVIKLQRLNIKDNNIKN